MRRPLIDALVAIAVLSVMDAIIKGLVARLPVAEVAFLRFLFGSCVMVAVVAVARPGWPRAGAIRANALRAMLVVVTAMTFFYGLGALPLAEALILSFISPVVTAMLAVLLLGERLDRRIAGALAAGFAGVLVIVAGMRNGEAADANGGSLLGIVAILISAVTYAASNVLLRARARQDKVLIIVLIQNIAPALILAGPAMFLWVPPSASDAVKLLAVGILGVSGHLMLARAYANAEATRLAPLDYTALIWAAVIGFLAYDEVPTAWALVGAVLILAGAATASRR